MSTRQRKSINVEVGARIKQQRKARGLTREALSSLSGYSVSFLQEIERGRSGLSSESMKRISAVLGVSADFLLHGHVTSNLLDKKMACRLQDLDPEQLNCLETIIDAFLESHRKT